jgi:hypothetical protein
MTVTAGAQLARAVRMARIRMRLSGQVLRITIAGVLRASDMGRLEHACAGALTTERLALELDLRRVVAMDQTAEALLQRMRERGANVLYADDGRRAENGP